MIKHCIIKKKLNQSMIYKSICRRFDVGNATRQTIDLGITLSHRVSYSKKNNISFFYLKNFVTVAGHDFLA